MKLTASELKEFDEFVYSHPNGTVLQTSSWTKVKDNWDGEYVVVRDNNGKICGTCLAILRKFPVFNYTFMYCPRGPVCDYTDYDTMKKIHSELLKIAKKRHAVSIKIDSPVLAGDTPFSDFMQGLGYKLTNDYYDFEGIQYRFTVKVNIDRTDEEIMAQFKRKTRYAMKTSLEHCTSRLGTREDIELFNELMNNTAEKHGFERRPKEYFYKLYDAFAPDHCAVFICGDGEDVLSGTICLVAGDTAMYLYGANAAVKQKLGANYAVQMAMYDWARGHGAKWFDMCGIPKEPVGEHAGLHIFKTKFADITEYMGEFDYVCDKFGYFIFVKGKDLLEKVKHRRRLKRLQGKEEQHEENSDKDQEA